MQTGTHILKNGDIEILIPICPYTKKNHQQIVYSHNRPIVIPSKEYKQYERDSFVFFKPLHIDYPVNIKAVYYMKTKRRVDLVNLHEALHDIMTNSGLIEDDNCNVIVSTDGSEVRYDKENPRTEIYIKKRNLAFTSDDAIDMENRLFERYNIYNLPIMNYTPKCVFDSAFDDCKNKNAAFFERYLQVLDKYNIKTIDDYQSFTKQLTGGSYT